MKFFMLLLAGFWSLPVQSLDVLGSAGITYRHYWDEPLFSEQEGGSTTEFVFEPEAYGEVNDHIILTFKGFARKGADEGDRSHSDIRELLLTFRGNSLDFSFGVGKVFWGVTESRHLVDVINQIDLIEDVLEEEKLGQPMLSFSGVSDWGNISFYWLPYFRTREYPNLDQRFRYPTSIYIDSPLFLDGRHNHNRDYVLRYSNSLDEIDIGLSYFNGNGRAPWFLNIDGVLKPIYAREKQAGIDLQYTVDAWLIKHESIYNSNRFEDYFATVNGFEYTFFQLSNGAFDLGVLVEHLYNNKNNAINNVFNNDVFIGVRVALNDVQSSSILFGVTYDPKSSEGVMKFKSEKRIGQDWTISISAIQILNSKISHQSISNDSFIEANILYNF